MACCIFAIIVVEALASSAALSLHRTFDSQTQQEAGTSSADQFRSLRVAIAWHGHYNRNDAPHSNHGSCSDFFHIAPNINQMVMGPLVQAGATVRHYVHSYNRLDCPAKDAQLLAHLQPVRHAFFDRPRARIVDSYIEVLNMVMEDSGSIDFVLLMRFDVVYALPVTAWNMTLDTVGVAFFSHFHHTVENRASDLLYTLPMQYAPHLAHALDESGDSSRLGAGHQVYGPLARRIGESNIRVMDYRVGELKVRGISTVGEGQDMKSFLGIDRNCGSRYTECPAAIPAPVADHVVTWRSQASRMN